MRKNILSGLLILTLAFAIGFSAAPGLVQKAEAGPQCGGAECAYFFNCWKNFASCSECGGGWCQREYDGTCPGTGTCCGSVVRSCCGMPCP